MKKWKTLKTESILESDYINLTRNTIEMPSGKIIEPWYRIVDVNFSVVVPVTLDKKIVIVEQYRYGVEEYTLELPSGKINRGESSENAAKRELREETGYTSDSFERIACDIAEDSSMKTNRFDVFIAHNVKKTHEQFLDHTEEIEVIEFPFLDAIHMAMTGKVIGQPSIIGLFMAAFHLGHARLSA